MLRNILFLAISVVPPSIRRKNNNEIIKVIHDIFTRDDIDACYIFGSFLTSRFKEQSDIDIAVVGNIELEDRLYIE